MRLKSDKGVVGGSAPDNELVAKSMMTVAGREQWVGMLVLQEHMGNGTYLCALERKKSKRT